MIGDKLKELRENTGMNKKDFANYIGVKYTTYNGYETGVREPASDFLIMLSKKLDVSIDYIMGISDEKEKVHCYPLKSIEFDHIKKYRDLDPHGKEVVDCVMNIEAARMQKESQSSTIRQTDKLDTTNIVYFEEKVSAGRGWEFMDSGQRILSVHENDLTRKADYAVSVKGDSMLPMYADGDILLVREQPDVNIGEVGIFIAAGKAYVKKRGAHSLISINDGYPDISIPDGETAVCQGKVLGVLHTDWIVEMGAE